MKTVKLEYVRELFQGLLVDDYNSICKAGRLISDILEGLKDIEDDGRMAKYYKLSLYRKYMRAYTRYIKQNPHCINNIAIDCSFTSMEGGEFTYIDN